jgi:hypothetical protein
MPRHAIPRRVKQIHPSQTSSQICRQKKGKEREKRKEKGKVAAGNDKGEVRTLQPIKYLK